MSTKHTPGKLNVLTRDRGFILTAKDGIYDVAVVRNIGNEDNAANAARLALCWNTHDQLVAALEWHEQFMPRDGESSSGRYDRIAEVFYKETGYIAPGKDAPMCSGTSYEDRLAAWDKWAKDGLERTRAAIKAAKGEA